MYVYEPAPPVPVTVAAPVDCPLIRTCVDAVMLAVNDDGSVRVKLAVVTAPLPSVTVTV
jgi:hypothetical protein